MRHSSKGIDGGRIRPTSRMEIRVYEMIAMPSNDQKDLVALLSAKRRRESLVLFTMFRTPKALPSDTRTGASRKQGEWHRKPQAETQAAETQAAETQGVALETQGGAVGLSCYDLSGLGADCQEEPSGWIEEWFLAGASGSCALANGDQSGVLPRWRFGLVWRNGALVDGAPAGHVASPNQRQVSTTRVRGSLAMTKVAIRGRLPRRLCGSDRPYGFFRILRQVERAVGRSKNDTRSNPDLAQRPAPGDWRRS